MKPKEIRKAAMCLRIFGQACRIREGGAAPLLYEHSDTAGKKAREVERLADKLDVLAMDMETKKEQP